MPSTCHKKPLKHFELKSRYTGKKVYRTSLKLVRARGPSQECPGRSNQPPSAPKDSNFAAADRVRSNHSPSKPRTQTTEPRKNRIWAFCRLEPSAQDFRGLIVSALVG